MKIGDKLEVLVEGMDKDGKGIAYFNKKIIFIEGAIINEKCEIVITKVLSKLIEAKVIKIITPSPDRLVPDCQIYENCGGCNLRHLSYDLEKKIKKNKVFNTIKHTTKLVNFKMNDIISNNKINHYRNKAIVPFSEVDGKIICGMFKPHSHKIVDNTFCLIEPILLEDILIKIKAYLSQNNISIYDETTKKGLFRAVMCRKTKSDDYMIVLIVTKNYDFSGLVDILKENRQIKSIYLNINDLNTNVLLGNKNILIYGDKTIKENILNHNFLVSPNTFMQVNNKMAELLYTEALRMLGPNLNTTIIDAYCGMGSISLSLASKVKKVIGIEVVESAILDARKNAKLNNITNASFILGKCEDKILEVLTNNKVDAMVFDPPRKGCETSFLEAVIKSKIKRIVYISCNIATLARDIKYLSPYYDLVEVTPVDMFPRTSHVETVALLNIK